MKYTITVTQADIDAGRRNDCENCPIALAMRRAMGKDVLVGSEDYTFLGQEYLLPREAVDFIYSFDRDGTVTPFTFDVEVAG